MTGQAVIDVGPAGAGLLYDSRRGVYYAKPLLHGRRWPDPYPSVLGYHEVIHVYVCAAAVCPYAAIARFAG